MDMNSLSHDQLEKIRARLIYPLQYCRGLRTKMFKLRWPHDELWMKVGRAEDALDELFALVGRLQSAKQKESK